MIVCPQCGKLNSPDAQTCVGCARLLAPGATAVVPPPRPFSPPGASNVARPPATPEARGSLASMPPLVQTGQPNCLVCGAALQRNKRYVTCSECGAPEGSVLDPNDVFSGRFIRYEGHLVPLQHAALLPGLRVFDDTSVVPGWNWGAALCSAFWAARHRGWFLSGLCFLNLAAWTVVGLILPLTILFPSSNHRIGPHDVFVASVLLVADAAIWVGKTAYLGARGNTIAWNSGIYTSLEQMRAAQSLWARRGARTGVAFLLILAIEMAVAAFNS